MRRTPLQLKIPTEMRETLATDPIMKQCIFKGTFKEVDCEGRVEWNHGFTYASKRQNELWAIVPLCTYHHRTEASHRREIRGFMRMQMGYYKADDDFNTKYPKSDLRDRI